MLTHQDEVRVFRAGPRLSPPRLGRRRPSLTRGRRLGDVACPADALALLPAGLPASFDTAELAAAAGIDRRLAQQMAYCLRHAGALEPTGKRGRAALYRLARL